MEITEVRVFPVQEEKLKAYVTITLDRCFVVRGLKIIQGSAGLFVAMPAKRRKDGTFKDVAHPLNTETRERMARLVTAARGVRAFLAGHDHDLQHLELEGRFTTHLLSGGGGARTRKMEVRHKVPFGQDVHGFTHLQITAQALTFTHYSADGAALHTVTKLQDGSFKLG